MLSFSVSGNRFYASKTCAIDFSHKNFPWKSDFQIKNAKNKKTIFAFSLFFETPIFRKMVIIVAEFMC
jgi:hypothetical protein